MDGLQRTGRALGCTYSPDVLDPEGALTRQAAGFLEAAVASGLNVLVCDGTQAGKITLLNCLLVPAIPARAGGYLRGAFELAEGKLSAQMTARPR